MSPDHGVGPAAGGDAGHRAAPARLGDALRGTVDLTSDGDGGAGRAGAPLRRPSSMGVMGLLVPVRCRARLAALVAALLLVVSGCGRTASRVFEGYYFTGFETSNFVPGEHCTSLEPTYWLVAERDSGLHEALERAGWNPAAFQAFFVRFEGELSAPGRYGHLGAYGREVSVRKVLEVRLAPECAPGGR